MQHGRKKQPKVVLTEEQKKANAEKIEKLIKINQELLQRRAAKQYTAANLELTEKAGALFDDNYTVWNFRRELMQELVLKQADKPLAEKYAFMAGELKLLLKLMMRNPKSFTLWYHRMWCIEQGLDLDKQMKSDESEILKSELGLCEKLIVQDGRNFHCWNYKSWLQGLELESIEKKFAGEENRKAREAAIRKVYEREYDYASRIISQNFSNYAAWFYRSKILPHLFPDPTYLITRETMKKELETLKQALYTDPKDQSCWYHHRWLVALVLPVQVVGVFPQNVPSGTTSVVLQLGISHKIYKLDFVEVEVNGKRVEPKKVEAMTEGLISDMWKIALPETKPGEITEISLTISEGKKAGVIDGQQVLRPTKLVWKRQGETIAIEPVPAPTKESELDRVMREVVDLEISELKELIDVEEGLVYAVERLCELCTIKRDYFSNPIYGFRNAYVCKADIEAKYAYLSSYKKGSASEVLYQDLIHRYHQLSETYVYLLAKMEGKEAARGPRGDEAAAPDLAPHFLAYSGCSGA